MIYRTSEEEIASYKEAPGINQSLLKLLTKGVAFFNENLTEEQSDLYFEEKEHFIIGSAVDCKLTEGEDVFFERYHIADANAKPSDTIMSIVKMIFDNYTENYPGRSVPMELNDADLQEAVAEGIEYHQYQPRWGAEAKYNKVVADGNPYWGELVISRGKQILSADQYALISTIVESLKTHPHTARIFSIAIDSEDYDIVYQFPIFFEYNGVQCKGLLDMVFIDHKNKTIAPIDLKTLFDSTINFPAAVRKRRYDFQASYYTEGIRLNKSQLATKINKHLIDYTFRPFTFIIESTKRPGNPLVFVCNKELLTVGKYGINELHYYNIDVANVFKQGAYLKSNMGFDQAIELYKWHLENGFDRDRVVAIHNGVLNFGWHDIIKG